MIQYRNGVKYVRKVFLASLLCIAVIFTTQFIAPASEELPSDSDLPTYTFNSLEQLAAKFKEIKSLPKPSDWYIDRFYDNEIIYFPTNAAWMKDGFKKIVVNINRMHVEYEINGELCRFEFFHPNGSPETGEQFYNRHILDKRNFIDSFEYDGKTITRARYYMTGMIVYAWQQDGCYFHWVIPESSSLTLPEIAAACRAVPYSAKGGVLSGKYTGWTNDAKYRYYYKDGVRQTGWQQLGGGRYFFNRHGVMRTGSVMTDWESFENVYQFDSNGLWDGKAALPDFLYTPETLGDFLLDHDYPINRDYEACLENDVNYEKFTGIKTVMEILKGNRDAKLLYGEILIGDLIDTNPHMFRGEHDIHIRLPSENEGIDAPIISFSKDKAGNSYYYNKSYCFGVKLNDPGAYDKILKAMGK